MTNKEKALMLVWEHWNAEITGFTGFSYEMFILFNLDDNNDLIEVNSWVEIEYKRYVFEYFTYCLKTLSESNETIENNVC